MFIVYFGLVIIGLVLVLYFGLKLSEDIYHPILVAFFWILYIASVLTISNVVATGLFYNVLRYKKGIPGDQGRIGDKGDRGDLGVCDTNCDSKLCTMNVLKEVNKYYQDLITKTLGKTAILNENPKINNSDITDRIKLMCQSQAYKEVAKIKTVKTLNDYIIDIYQKWIKLLVESDNSKDKTVIRDYLETDGYEDVPVLKDNPFKEIEKYDIYYWGSDRIFHPRVIEYCAEPEKYQQLGQKEESSLKGLRTNLYSNIFASRNAARLHLSVFRVEPYNYQNLVYYPLGDIFVNGLANTSNTKFIEKYGVDDKERTVLPNTVSTEGPSYPTLVVTGPEMYLRAPEDWVLVWRNKGLKNSPPITIWRPQDFYDNKLKKWFRACGCLAMPNWSNSTPRQQYGYNTPERQPIRLIAEELLSDVSAAGLNQVWNSYGSATNTSISIWNSQDVEYIKNFNVSVINNGYMRPKNSKVYIIRDSAFTSQILEPIDFKDPLVDEDNLGIGFHGAPHRSPMYSVFQWLDMPLEVQVTNIANASKIYIKHSGLNTINSYCLRRQLANSDQINNVFGVKGNEPLVTDNFTFNVNNKNLMWEIVCIDKNGNVDNQCNNGYYLIISVVNNKYFKVEVNTSTAGPLTYLANDLPDKNNPNYATIIQEFIWYNPKSATGSKLEMTNNKQTKQ